MRRALLPAVTALVLAGCGGEATYPGSSADEPQGGETPDVACTQPPTPPAEPRSYTQDDLPEPLSGERETLAATIETTCGDIELELYAGDAPQTVASFAFLAQEGYWEDSACHRLVTSGIFVLQCGDPTGTGQGSPGYAFGIENAPPDGLYPPGTLAMARTQDPDSNGGQFFIVYDDTQLPVGGGGYSIFGRVTAGLDIVETVAAEGNDSGGTAPAQPISLLSVSVDD